MPILTIDRPCVADVACKERARVMRLAGTVNYKTGQHARIVEALEALVDVRACEGEELRQRLNCRDVLGGGEKLHLDR